MIDIHSHIIPGIDDGAKDKETTLKMLKMAQRDGIKKIVATPHFMKERFEVPFKKVEEKVEEINRWIQENGLDIEVMPGQEIFLNKKTLEDFERGLLGGLNGSEYYLFELHMAKFDKRLPEVIYELTLHGVKPIIAHPERYRYIIEDVERLNRLIEEGCLFQLNIGSIEGMFGPKIKKCAQELLKLGVYDFVGTDTHDLKRRTPVLREKAVDLKKRYSQEVLELMANNEDLIEGNFYYKKKRKITKKGFLASLFKK